MGDEVERLSAMFEVHADRLYRLARRLVHSREDALDLVQDTFLRAARSPTSIPGKAGDHEAWLVRVLINLRRDRWRKEAVRRRDEPLVAYNAPRNDDPEQALLIRHTIWAALDRLSPRRRAILVMRDIDDMDVAAIASLLGITAITVRWHLSRGRRELARVIGLDTGDSHGHRHALAGRRSDPARSSTS